MVLILPRVGVLAAAEISPVSSPGQIASQNAGFEREARDRLERDRQEVWAERTDSLRDLSEAERQAVEDENMWTWMQEDDEARRQVQEEIDVQAARLEEDQRNRRRRQEAIALGLSRWSPPSAFRSAVMRLAATHVDMASRAESAMRQYKEDFRQYQLEKDPAGGALTMRSDGDRRNELGNSQKLSGNDLKHLTVGIWHPAFVFTSD